MRKRLLSIALALCTALSLLPATAFPTLAAEGAGQGEKEIDQSTYDALGLRTDADAQLDKTDASATPYGMGTTQMYTGREVYAAANGRSGNRYTLRDGLNHIDQNWEPDISDGGGNLNGAYSFYGINPSIKNKNGGTFNSALSSNQGSNVLANQSNDFSGIYATSVAFNGGDHKDNYVAELRAYGNNDRVLRLHLFKFSSNGSRRQVAAFEINDLDIKDWFESRKYIQELDATLEVTAGDLNGDGVDEVYFYAGHFKDDSNRKAVIGRVMRNAQGEWTCNQNFESFCGGSPGGYDNKDWGGTIYKRPCVTLSCGDIDRDNKEELAVAVSATYNNAAYNQSHAYVYKEGEGNILDFDLQDPNDKNHSMTAVNCTFGNFEIPGTSITGTVLIVGGYHAYYKDSKGFSQAAYRYAYYNPTEKNAENKYVISDFCTKDLGGKSRIITNSQSSAPCAYAPLALSCGDLEGVGVENNNDEVLFGAEVYHFGIGSGLTDQIGSISLCTSQVNDNNNNKSKSQVWIGDVRSGCVSSGVDGDVLCQGNQAKRWADTFLCVVGTRRDGDINSDEDYYWMDLSGFWLKGNDRSAYSTQEGVIAHSNTRNDKYGTYVSLCLPDVDDDSVQMKYSDQYTLYTNPEVYAVMQASPYFNDVAQAFDNYNGNGATAFGTSTGEGKSNGGSLSQSVGVYTSAECSLFAEGEVEAEVSASVSYEYSKNTMITHSITYNNRTGGDDAVVVYAIPYIYYVYDMYAPVKQVDGSLKREWITTILPVALTPVTTVLGVDEYDKIAATTAGMDPIRGNILYSNPGDPSSYVNKPSGKNIYTYDGDYVRCAITTTLNDVTQEISKEVENSHSIEAALEVNLKVGGGVGFLGTGAVAGATSSTSAGYSHAWLSSAGTTFSGTVDSLPPEASQYGFSWKLIVNEAPLNGGKVWVVGYDIKDILEPPQMPQNLTVSEMTNNAITLSWEDSGSAAYYEVYEVTTTGEYNYLVTLPYTVTTYEHPDLEPNTNHVYSVRAVSTTKGSSIFSPTVNATTLTSNGGSLHIARQPEDTGAAPGNSAEFSVQGSYLKADGSTGTVSYQWQQSADGTNWKDLYGSRNATLTLSNVTDSMNSMQYRCRIYVNNINLYSLPGTLTVDKSNSRISFTDSTKAIDKTTLLASGTKVTNKSETVIGSKAVSVTNGSNVANKDYTLMHNGTSWFWFDGAAYYTYRGTVPTLIDGKIGTDVTFTTEQIGEQQILSKSDYKASISVQGADNSSSLDTLPLTEVTPIEPTSITVEGKLYTVNKKWTTSVAGYAGYSFYEATHIEGTESIIERFYTSNGTYHPFALSWTDKIGSVDVFTLSTAFQKTTTTVTTQDNTPVTGETITLNATPTAKVGDSAALAGDVTFVISGAGGTTLRGQKQADNSYQAQWTPTAEGRYTINAQFAGNAQYYDSQSDAITVYTVMKDNFALSLTAPNNLTYGGTANLVTTKITSNGDEKTYTDVTKDSGTNYTVQKLVSSNSGDSATSSTYQNAEATDYTLSDGVFTPKLATTFRITAQNGEKSAEAYLSVGKGTLTLAATDTDKAINSGDRTPNAAAVTGKAPWDEVSLNQGTDYTLTTDGTQAKEPGTYAIQIALKQVADQYSSKIQELQKNYNILLKNATYTLTSTRYAVNAAAGANGTVQVKYLTTTATGTDLSIPVDSGTNLPAGSKVSITAAPNRGYMVKQWTQNGDVITTGGSDADRSTIQTIHSLDAAASYRVEFEEQYAKLTFRPDHDDHGTVTAHYLSGSTVDGTFTNGGNIHVTQAVRLTAQPKEGYAVESWTITKNGKDEVIKAADGTSNYTGAAYDLSNISDDTIVCVAFMPKSGHTVTINPVDSDHNPLLGVTVKVNGSELTKDPADNTYQYSAFTGENLTIQVTTPSGLLINSWTVGDGQTAGVLSADKQTMTVYNLKAGTDFTIHYSAPNRYAVQFSGLLTDGTFGADVGTVSAAKLSVGKIDSGSHQIQGSTILFTATAQKGYEITGWTLNGMPVTASGSAMEQTYQIPLLLQNAHVVVTYKALPYIPLTYGVVDKDCGTADSGLDGTLTASVERKGLETYRVTNDASGSLSKVYGDSTVTLTATPDKGYKVAKWLVNGTEQTVTGNTYPFPVDANTTTPQNIQVQFDPVGDQITYSIAGNPFKGTLSSSFRANGSAEDSAFASGSKPTTNGTMTFTLSNLDDDYEVEGWYVNNEKQGDGTDLTFSYPVVVNVGADIQVKLIRKAYTVDYSGQNSTVTATASGNPIGNSPATVRGDTPVTFTAAPTAAYKFDHWLVDGVKDAETSATLTLSVTKNTTVQAVCVLDVGSYTVTFGAGENGTLSANTDDSLTSPATVNATRSVTFTAEPAAGYQVEGWYSDESMTSKLPGTKPEQKTYTIDSLAADANVYVKFATIPSYTITVQTTGLGTVSAKVNGTPAEIASGTLAVQQHDKVELSATPGPNQYLTAWAVDSVDKGNSSLTLTLDDVSANTTVSANFAASQLVTFQAAVTGGNGTLSAEAGYGDALSNLNTDSSLNLEKGKKVVVKAAPDANYMVKAWTINGITQENYSNTLTIENLSENTAVTVEFEALETYAIPQSGTGYSVSDAVFIPNDYQTPLTKARKNGDTTFTVAPENDKHFTALRICDVDCLTAVVGVPQTSGVTGANSVSVDSVANGAYTITVKNVTADIENTITAAEGGMTITYSQPTGGVITVQAGGTPVVSGSKVAADTVLTITATANSNYILSSLTVNGTAFTSGSTYTVTDDITIAASFTVRDKTITYCQPTGGVIAVQAGGTPIVSGSKVAADTVLTITATANSNYTLSSLTINGTAFTSGSTYTVKDNVTIAASFQKQSGGGSSGSGGSGGGSIVSPPIQPKSEIIDQNQAKSLIQDAIDKKKGEISIKTDLESVQIHSSLLTDAAQKTNANLRVNIGMASLLLPHDSLGDLAAHAGTINLKTAIVKNPAGQTELTLSITADQKPLTKIPGGIIVTLPYPDGNADTVAMLTRADGTRTLLPKSIAKNGEMRTMMDEIGTVMFLNNPKTFDDTLNHWGLESIRFVSSHELMNGVANKVFSPNESMTRAMLSVVFLHLEGNPESAGNSNFADVVDNAWYAKAIKWAVSQHIVSGYGDGTFGPNDSITREQLAVMFYRYAGSPATNGSLDHFSDASSASEYALSALRWAVENSIISGKGNGILDPKGNATRAEVCQMLKNFC